MPLTTVLTDLKKDYNLSLSFASNQTDSCFINIHQSFISMDEALRVLCAPCQLNVKQLNNVYVIVSQNNEKETNSIKIEEKRHYHYRLKIQSKETEEELGLSKIKVNNYYYLADINGFFSIDLKTSKIRVEISHLGYLTVDTLLFPSQDHIIALNPYSEKLITVEVQDKSSIQPIQLGDDPGQLSINNKSNGFLAGESNNAIFNTLRLQPGILSAGEESSDYVIWNSYKGQNHLIFDGMTLFKTNSYNQSISGINPALIKTINVYKGAYNADIGDRIGGIIDIKSKTGNFKTFQSSITLNNQLVNAYLNVPLFSKASFQASFRHTFNNPLEIKLKTEFIQPETEFTDVNLKFSTVLKSKNPFKISFIHNNDSYKESLKDKMNLQLASAYNNSVQTGISIYYGVNWNNGGTTDFSISQSELKTTYTNTLDLNPSGITKNGVNEKSIRISHRFKSTKSHQTKIGLNLINNQSFFRSDSSSFNIKNISEELNRFNLFVTDSWHLNVKLIMNYGLKIEIPININTMSIQPRIAFKYLPVKEFNIYGSWGIYNQFMSEMAVLDVNNNNLFHWSILNENYKPNQAQHYVFGTSFKQHKWQISLEGFYKTSSNLLKFYVDGNDNIALSNGNSRTRGLDLFLSKALNKHRFWCGYTISQSEEYFSYFVNKSWQPAPQNQLHELKAAFVLNFKPVFISFNYVYGSGLTYYKSNGEKIIFPYNRMDIALKYQHSFEKFKIETGFSILNALNQSNLRFNSFSNFPEYEEKFVFSTPFSPFVFIKIRF